MKMGKRLLLSYYKPYRAVFTAVLVSAALAAALALVFPLLVRYIVNDVFEQNAPNVVVEVLKTGAVMLAVIFAHTAVTMVYDYKGHDVGAQIERDMRQALFTHYQKMPFGFYDERQTGELMSRLTSDLLDLAELLHHMPENIVVYGTQFVGSLILLFTINRRLTLIILPFLLAMGVYSFIFFRRLEKSYAENRRNIGEINAATEESLAGIRTVKSYNGENAEARIFLRKNNSVYHSKRRIYLDEARFDTVIAYLFTPLITVALVVAGGLGLADGTFDLANLLVFILYVAYLTAPVPKLAFMVSQYQVGLSGYRRFREIIDSEPEHDAPDAAVLSVPHGKVVFDNISFRYNEGLDFVLKNINLTVHAGETVAIVGRSGVGKTTLCSLLPRFYQPIGGKITIDGTDIQRVTLGSLREQIGVVSQETFLFAGTVMENILYGRQGATEEEAIEAAKNAHAHDFIEKLPNGYNTYIGQRGVKLSGGQRQRISIARVFLKNPKILILDEATSSLDNESERAVMDSLDRLAKGRTTFLIAHRLSTIQGADRVIELVGDGVEERTVGDS